MISDKQFGWRRSSQESLISTSSCQSIVRHILSQPQQISEIPFGWKAYPNAVITAPCSWLFPACILEGGNRLAALIVVRWSYSKSWIKAPFWQKQRIPSLSLMWPPNCSGGDYGDAGLTTIHCECIGRGVVDEAIVFMVLLRLTMVLIPSHIVDVNPIAADLATLIKSSFDLTVFRMYSAVR